MAPGRRRDIMARKKKLWTPADEVSISATRGPKSFLSMITSMTSCGRLAPWGGVQITTRPYLLGSAAESIYRRINATPTAQFVSRALFLPPPIEIHGQILTAPKKRSITLSPLCRPFHGELFNIFDNQKTIDGNCGARWHNMEMNFGELNVSAWEKNKKCRSSFWPRTDKDGAGDDPYTAGGISLTAAGQIRSMESASMAQRIAAPADDLILHTKTTKLMESAKRERNRKEKKGKNLYEQPAGPNKKAPLIARDDGLSWVSDSKSTDNNLLYHFPTSSLLLSFTIVSMFLLPCKIKVSPKRLAKYKYFRKE